MTTEGPTRAEAAAHILARETGRRMRAIQVRIDEVEEERRSALEAVASRLDGHDGTDARQDVLIDGLRVGLETVQAITTAIDAAHGETRELTAAQAQELASIASRLAANEQVDAAQDAELTGLTGRVEGLEARAPVPGPPGPKGERGPAGPPGRTGGYVGGGGSATIQSNGTTVANRPILNFVSGATVTDNGANNRVDITVSGGGSGAINSVTASSGLTVTGTSDLTITNTGVRSLSGSGLTVSASTGDVTLTAPTLSGGTGISVSGSGTTSITVSATGVNSVSAGTGISVSGTTALTVSATGVTSLAAGTNVSLSGSTGAVTINAPAFATPGSSAFGDTAAAGTATTVSRSDHVHGREAAGTPGASAVGDTASAGVATTVARSDHRHSREAFGTPVNIDASLTSLSAGSLTTVARADHVHTVSSVPVLLGSVTLSSTSSSITFNNIPQTSKHLIIYGAWASNRAGQTVDGAGIRFNGDSTTAYYNAGGSLQTYGHVANPQGATAMSSQVGFNHINIYIPAYTTTSRKHTVGIGGTATNASFGQTVNTYSSIYNGTTAISSITLITLYGGSFTVGTSLQLWGYG